MKQLWLAVALVAVGAGVWLFWPRPVSGPPAPPGGGELPRAAVETALTFEEGGAATGIAFRHFADLSGEKWMPETLGSGLAVCDFNRDGAPDVLFVDAGPLLARDDPPEAGHRLFLNDGAGRFRDATAEWGLPMRGYGFGVAVGDVDGDGWNDLLLTQFATGVRLLRNTGAGFEDRTDAAGLARSGMAWPTAAAFFDMEGDGDLDLYVTQYVMYDLAKALKCYTHGVHVYCHPSSFRPLPDRLYENLGDGTFRDVSAERGVAVPGRGLALVTGDIDEDGDTDLYVANDRTRNFLWINDGRGYFTDEGRQRGVAYSKAGLAEAGMGADIGDLDGDGDLDLVCTNFQREATAIYRQEPGLMFAEVADLVGVGAASRRRLGFGVELFDADNDGDEDLVTANGHLDNDVALFSPGDSFAQHNDLFENDGGTLREVSAGAGSAFALRRVSRGLAAADLDGDGGLDLVVSTNDGPATVALNRTPQRGHFLVLWLEGTEANRTAIGARVLATVGGRELRQEVRGGSSYLSVSDFRVHFGLGAATGVEDLRIVWPGGQTQRVGALEGGFHRIVQGEAPVPMVPGEPIAP